MSDRAKKRAAIVARLGSLVIDERTSDDEKAAFEEMSGAIARGDRRSLSRAQEEWVARVEDRLNPVYENAWSAGKVPKGRDVAPPDVLKRENILKLPPRRCGICRKPGCRADCI